MGGGTVVVEALAAGRRAGGIDVNPLAKFVARAKTTPLSDRDLASISSWVESICGLTEQCQSGNELTDFRLTNFPRTGQSFFSAAIQLAQQLRFPRQRNFARCVLLRVGQLAFDNRKHSPKWSELQSRIVREAASMMSSLDTFVRCAKSSGVAKNRITNRRKLVCKSIADPEALGQLHDSLGAPRLVLTSPPYPGVHVLYHRWQIAGRRETPAPYWIADLRDGQGPSFFTMGGRSGVGVDNYFKGIRNGFENLRRSLGDQTTVVQLIAFSDATKQLPRYLEAIHAAGYDEMTVSESKNRTRLSRKVPNRRWYVSGTNSDSSREYLLIHRIR